MHQIPKIMKLRIISKKEDGWSGRQIARHFNLNKNSVCKILKKWREERSVERNPGVGRKRISSQVEDENLINVLKEHPFHNAVRAVQESNFPGSSRTARRRIQQSELRCRAAAKKILLKPEHKESRVGFALEHLAFGQNFWHNIVFSDEKTFQSSASGNIRVYRPQNVRYEERYVNQVENRKFSVNMWGCISARGSGVLCHIEERLTSHVYINLLQNVMVPSATNLFPENDYVFQQDNCPVHTANIVSEWFTDNDISLLNWPSRSPDLNPMENVWAELVKTIKRQNVRPQNAQQLLEILTNAWETITQNYCLGLCNSMTRRLTAVITKNGAMTKYSGSRL
jgi:transposase